MLNLLDDEEEGPKEQPLAPVALRVPRILEQVTPSYRAREEDEESEEEDFPPPLPGSAAARAECVPGDSPAALHPLTPPRPHAGASC